MMRYLLLPLILALLFNGCARESAPTHAPPLTMVSAPIRSEEWPPAEWWKRGGDPELDRFTQSALRGNPSMEETEAKIERTDLCFAYEFAFWKRNRERFRTALGEKAGFVEHAQTALILSIAVAHTYFTIQADLLKRTLLQEIKNQRTALLKLTQAGYAQREIELLQMSQEIVEIEKQCLDLEQKIAAHTGQLNALVPPVPGVEGVKPSLLPSFPMPEKIGADLLARRPDLMVHIERLELAARGVGAVQVDFYPNVDILASGGLESLFLKKFIPKDRKTDACTPAIHLPIFAAGRLKAPLSMQAIHYKEAVYEYRELLLRAAREAAEHLSVLRFVNDQVHLQTQALGAARQNYALAFFRFTQGASGYLPVLQAEKELLEQRLIDVELQYRRLVSTLNLIQALGGSYF